MNFSLVQKHKKHNPEVLFLLYRDDEYISARYNESRREYSCVIRDEDDEITSICYLTETDLNRAEVLNMEGN